jgi:hypothetical protein
MSCRNILHEEKEEGLIAREPKKIGKNVNGERKKMPSDESGGLIFPESVGDVFEALVFEG